MRQRSSKATAQQHERVKIVKAMAGHTGRLVCSNGCGREAVDVDELVNRSQLKDAAVTPELMRPLCRKCHDWKHRNPNAAEVAGLYVRGSTYRKGRLDHQ